jgi:hypothetical protein
MAIREASFMRNGWVVIVGDDRIGDEEGGRLEGGARDKFPQNEDTL